MEVNYREHVFSSQWSLRYLGVQLDSKMNFAKHADLAVKRAAGSYKQISRRLPNARGPRQRSRKLLSCVVLSRLLYGAPFCFPTMNIKSLGHMTSLARRFMLRVGSCYSTVSHEAAAVVSGIPPLDFLASERTMVYGGVGRKIARDMLLEEWERRWEVATCGRWTHRLIGNLRE